jgi:hypothetical protein
MTFLWVGIHAAALALATLISLQWPEFLAVHFVVVYFFGALLGYVEIVSRFRDAPFAATLYLPAVLYSVFNGLASSSAYWLMQYLDVSFGATGPIKHVLQVFTAGFGAMAFLRSGIFILKAGKNDKEILVGPGVAIQMLLDALGEAVKRSQAQSRLRAARLLAERVSLKTLTTDVPSIVVSTLEVTGEDSTALRSLIAAISADAQTSDTAKKQTIVLLLLNLAGEPALVSAVENVTRSPDPQKTV